MNLAVAFGKESVRRPDRREHAARRREAIEIRTVFVADEKTAVGQQHQGFGIDADAPVRRLRKVRKTVGGGTDAVRIEPGERFSRRVGEQDRIGQGRDDALLPLRLRHGGRIVERLQGDGKLVEARAIVGRAADVIAAVGQHIERALITRRRSHPGPGIDRDAGPGAEGFTELVAQIGRHPPDSDQSLVDEDKIADRDGLGSEYRRRRGERVRDQCRQRDDPQCAQQSRGKENTGAIEHVHFLERFQEDADGRRTHCHCICGVTIPCERPSGCPRVDNAPPRR